MSECQRDPIVAEAWALFEKSREVMDRISGIERQRLGVQLRVPSKTYCFDLDGTLCSQESPERYGLSTPNVPMIEAVRRLKAQGHTIIIHTARAPSKGGDPTGTTVDQLRAWGVLYDRLYLGKPAADVYVDDRGVAAKDFLFWLVQTSIAGGEPDQSGGGDVP